MSENILNNIISKKIERVDALKKSITLNSLNKIIDKNNTFIDFKEKIQNNIIQDKISIIAEIKKVFIEVLFCKSKSSSFVLIPLSEIKGP